MQERNLLEDLVAVSPGMEIWWDSSPVIFGNWCTKMLAKADAADQDNLKRQFKRMYNTDDPMSQLFREEPDVREVIKLKAVYELLESITDRCEDVANLVEGIVLKSR